jgi:hypothetical protein
MIEIHRLEQISCVRIIDIKISKVIFLICFYCLYIKIVSGLDSILVKSVSHLALSFIQFGTCFLLLM